MSAFDDPFDPRRRLRARGCSCGAHRSESEHAAAARVEPEERLTRVVEGAVMRALFPEDATRRAFLTAVGASTALAAVAQFLPIGAATDAFAQGGTLEKKDLKVGFIPITCATPIIMAAPMGFYTKQGLNV
jgi:nitrate/nitrite transport system substrate-binding protein